MNAIAAVGGPGAASYLSQRHWYACHACSAENASAPSATSLKVFCQICSSSGGEVGCRGSSSAVRLETCRLWATSTCLIQVRNDGIWLRLPEAMYLCPGGRRVRGRAEENFVIGAAVASGTHDVTFTAAAQCGRA